MERIYRHPNGFVKIQLTDDDSERLHVWYELSGDADVHNHRRDFTSCVLEGEIVEEIWDVTDTLGGGFDRFACDSHTPDGICKLTFLSRCDIKLLRQESRPAGTEYKRDRDVFHRVTAVKVPAVTRVSWSADERRRSTVVRPHVE